MSSSANTADFYLRLHEQVNAPAKRARDAIKQLSGGLVASRAELARTESALRRHFQNQQKAPQQSLRADIFSGTFAGNVAAQALGFVARGALEATSAVLGLGASFVTTTAQALDFGQRSRLAFGSLIGDAETGRQTFDNVRREAQALGLDVHNTVDSYRDLLAAQFKVSEANELIRASADLKAIGADAHRVQLALLALTQIKMKGVLQAEEMRQLVNTGVSAELIYDNLAKTLGKTRAEVLKMQEKREITAPQAIEAFKTAIKQKTHEENLGDTATKFANQKISGLLAQMRGKIANEFIDLGTDLEPTATRITQLFFGAFQRIGQNPALTAARTKLIETFKSGAVWIQENWPKIEATVTNVATTVANAFSATTDYIRNNAADIRAAIGGVTTIFYVGGSLALDFGRAVLFIAEGFGFLLGKISAVRQELASFLKIAGIVVSLTGVGAIVGIPAYLEGAHLEELDNRLAAIDRSSSKPTIPGAMASLQGGTGGAPILGGAAGGKSTSIGNINIGGVTVQANEHDGSPEGQGDAAGNAAMRKFMSAMEQS